MFRSLRICLAATMLCSSVSAFAETLTKDVMVKFVQEAVAHVKKVGKEKALKEFSDPKGTWVRNNGELYLFAYDYTGVCVGHGFKQALIGKNLLNLQDKKGTFFQKEMTDKAKKDGKGFVEFYWENPASKKVERKQAYVETAGDFWIGSGIYLGE